MAPTIAELMPPLETRGGQAGLRKIGTCVHASVVATVSGLEVDNIRRRLYCGIGYREYVPVCFIFFPKENILCGTVGDGGTYASHPVGRGATPQCAGCILFFGFRSGTQAYHVVVR